MSHYIHLTEGVASHWNHLPIERLLISVMEELELIDIFRKQFPQKLSFSNESQALNVCSRI